MATQDKDMGNPDQVSQRRLIMVSNRLPVTLEQSDDGQWQAQPASGGLVAAIDPIMRRRGGVWVGWPGVVDIEAAELRAALDEHHGDDGDYRLEPVALSSVEFHGFYEGFSNEVIWPLFHNRLNECRFEPEYWRIYQQVNCQYARTIDALIEADDFVWVHDYQLINVAEDLRASGVANRIGFFNHIPFPTADIFGNVPWWKELLRGLLAYDFIGVQTATDRTNLVASFESLFAGVRVSAVDNHGCVNVAIDDSSLDDCQSKLRLGALPIGIDYDSVASLADSPEALEHVHRLRNSCSGTRIALGVDRLDYSKGLSQKLIAFRNALERYPELRSRISLHQHVVPSRQQIPGYAAQKAEIEQLAGEINGEFTEPGWVPVHYMYHRVPPAELMAYYRVADMALITPVKDGMNLVAKEYCAANLDESGVLILSEFAGSAAELGEHALLVNPQDMESTADRIYEAYCMSADDRRRRMRALRAIVRDNSAFEWVRRFLEAAGME